MSHDTIAQVYIMDAPYHIDRLYDYYIPADMRGDIVRGGFCIVPFGGGNRRNRALVYGIAERSEYSELKPVLSVLEDTVVLSDEMLKLSAFLKEHTFCTMGDAVRTILPAAAISKLRFYYRASSRTENYELVSKLGQKQLFIYNYVKSMGTVTLEKIIRDTGEASTAILKELTLSGLLEAEMKIKEPSNKKYTEIVSLLLPPDEILRIADDGSTIRGKKQQDLLRMLCECSQAPVKELQSAGFTRVQIKSLCDKNLIKISREDDFRNPYHTADDEVSEISDAPLSEAQKKAKDEIYTLYKSPEAKAALLHGITGSGKTRVITSLIDEVLKDGRNVIVLIPEISLTPQTVGIFKALYGNKIAVIHSQLSAGERFDAWRRMKNGDVNVCIGTRSAIFAPLENIGLIVIDEEQEHTYKSDMNPKYHARDIARFRCAYHKATMLLASATPSFESYHKAVSGVYSLIELNERYGDAELPQVHISDLRKDASDGSISPIGSELRQKLAETLEKKEQAILFLNRRGYNHFLSCVMCGHVITCPHCSVSLTYHTFSGAHGGCLYCHYCGYRAPVPKACPECGSEPLRYVGYGTQKVEEELRELFPSASIMRMDADSTTGKFSYDKMLSDFREGAADILLGTQMVTKGHDFPNVTLVGVISADSSLYIDDFRAIERTFSTLTQVIGRAGRAEKPGYALIQTYNPDHPVIKMSCNQDYAANYKNEIPLRRALVFPPFCDIILVTLSAVSEGELMRVSAAFAKRLRELLGGEFSDTPMTVFGPIEAPLYKINEIYRLRMVLKCRANSRTRQLISRMLCEFEKKTKNKITISADINPNNL